MSPGGIFLVVVVFTSALYVESSSSIEYTNDNAEDIVFLNESPHRLPKTTSPRHYTLTVRPDFDTFLYSGHIIIQAVAQQDGVDQIVLNSEDLFLTSITVIYGDVDVLESSFTDDYNMLHLNLNADMVYNPVQEAVYVITIYFNAPLRNDLLGFYRSWYDDFNEVRWMAATQFGLTYARRAFPCYDEPSFKAVFVLIIQHHLSYRSWSNMNIQSTTSMIDGFNEDIFYPTPIMSTYLLAFIVASYDSLNVYNDEGLLTYEVIGRSPAIQNGQGDYAFQVGQELLAAMENYTQILYASMAPNMKMTQASVPDFSFSAMENWGLITYREVYLMYDPLHTNSRFQQITATILTHEIAHMWFGNLVTCDWWDAAWLNEGFARYFEYFITDLVEERMDLDTRFITEQVHTALFADSINSAHPLTDPSVDSPNSVLAHFSTILYNKGAVIIRMTEHLLGDDVFRLGLQNYLSSRAYETAVPTDLFRALDEVAASSDAIAQYGVGFTIDEYYRSWTEKAGYPLLYVHVNHSTGYMTIQQRRFDRDVGYSSINSNWIIPITFASAGSPDFNDTKPTHIIIDTISIISRGTIGDQWVIFNKQQTGFYRVHYDDYTWSLITLALRGNDRSVIHEHNRAQIVDDVFQLARSGLMSYTRAFNILSFLEFENDYAPWVAAITGFNWLRRRFAGTEQLTTLESMFAGWASNLMTTLTYSPLPDDTWMRSYLRWQLATVLCSFNDPQCRTVAIAQFVNLRDNAVEVPNDSRSWVYCNALRDGTEVDFTFLWDRFQNHPVYTEKIVLLENLGCTPHANSLDTYLQGITYPNTQVRPQDYNTAFNSAVNGNEQNTQIVFAWVKNNMAILSNAFSNIATPLSYISNRLLNEQEIQEFEEWALLNQDLLGSAYTAIVNNAAATRDLITWTTTISADVGSYLENGYQADVTTTEATPPTTDEPTTVLPPDVEPPVVPDDDGGAAAAVASTFLCIVLVVAAVVSSSYTFK